MDSSIQVNIPETNMADARQVASDEGGEANGRGLDQGKIQKKTTAQKWGGYKVSNQRNDEAEQYSTAL